ncbi:MAG: type IV pilus assembly protein PilM [Acidimicrobiia bacterium]|nr:type IV pilus assembly protein PilM [Acidimicrobiia bacterium]
MARRVIGLDIGTHAVRVAEVELDDPPRVVAFGQVALPYEAVREGEIVDPAAVTKAVARLWSELGLGKGEVRVGIASPRVIVRTIDMPVMSDADLAGALRFQAGDLIPIPIDEAAFDFQVLEQIEKSEDADPDAEPMQRVLFAAAHRDTVTTLVDAVRAAGVRVSAVDLVPLALVRALGRRVGTNGPAAEAIASVGAGTTVVAIHESGIPRFVRIVGGGGRSATAAIESALGLSVEDAEAIKRDGSSDPAVAAQVDAAVSGPMRAVVEAIRGSVDFYRGQSDARPVLQVTLTGGGASQRGLLDAVSDALELPTSMASPRRLITVGEIGFSVDDVPDLDPYLPVPVGLALSALGSGKRINLLPDKGAEIDRKRILTLAGAIGAALLVILGFMTFLASSRLSNAEADRDKAQAKNTLLEAEAATYADAQSEKALVDGLSRQAVAVLATDVSWSRMLQEIARTIPNDSWLTAFQGSTTAPTSGAATFDSTSGVTGSTGAVTPSAGVISNIGTASFSATGLDFTSVASWIQRIGEIPSFSGLWVPSATKDGAAGTTRSLVTYSSTANITSAATSDRTSRFGGQR